VGARDGAAGSQLDASNEVDKRTANKGTQGFAGLAQWCGFALRIVAGKRSADRARLH
jgi:hypothetical protein